MDRQDYSDTLEELVERRRSRRRFDLILRIYSWFGLLLSSVAGGYFLLTLLPIDLSEEQLWALMTAGVGVLLALMSRIVVTFYREREVEHLARLTEYEKLNEFLAAWSKFERVSREVLAEQGDDRAIHSLRSVISFLYHNGKIDGEDVLVLEEGLKARNSIVHGGRLMPTRSTDRLTTSLDEVIRKLAVTS